MSFEHGLDIQESAVAASHIVQSHFPMSMNDFVRWRVMNDSDDHEAVVPYLTDSANFPGGHSPGVIEFFRNADISDIASVLSQCNEENRSVVAIGAQTSLTGAAVPMGDWVLNLRALQKVEITKGVKGTFATVQPGVNWTQLQEQLGKQGFFVPAAPTYAEATVIGGINTNAAGARSYKYGSVREFVQGLRVILPNGELLEIERGQHISHPGDTESPGGFFVLQNEAGDSRRLPIPDYAMPDILKISAGYYAKPRMDLVDLFVGAEGTLGVIAEATLKTIKEPPTRMAMVPCESDGQAFDLIAALAKKDSEERIAGRAEAISAVEYLGSKVVELVQTADRVRLPDGTTFLFVQVEGDDTALAEFGEVCESLGVDSDAIKIADDSREKAALTDMREAAPHTVNEVIACNKLSDPFVTKVGSDPSVQPEDLRAMMDIYEEEFAIAGVKYCAWGHGEGNIHYNALPATAAEVEHAKAAVLRAGKRVIRELRGVGTAEHGVGLNQTKQALLEALYGPRGIQQMRDVKAVLDPRGIMAPGNIFAL